MKFSSVIFLLVIASIATSASEVKFEYDPSSELGPQNWAELDIESNQCGGMRQSGINIESSSCSEYDAPYTFSVSM